MDNATDICPTNGIMAMPLVIIITSLVHAVGFQGSANDMFVALMMELIE
jgi:hypothetical protein